MNARDCWLAGDLKGAVTAAAEVVKAAPTDHKARTKLAEFLCFSGEWDRADKHLEIVSTQNHESVAAALFRQLIRGETARQQVFSEGRVPEFMGPPTESMQLVLKALASLRAGDQAEAAALFKQAEDLRQHPTGQCNGQTFDDFRDLDDRFAPVLEVITGTGKYLWLGYHQIEHLRFKKPQTPRDTLWRLAEIAVDNGPEGEVYVPCLYPGAATHADQQIRLGGATDWAQGEISTGAGAREFLVGDGAKTLMEIQNLTFDLPESESAETPEGEA